MTTVIEVSPKRNFKIIRILKTQISGIGLRAKAQTCIEEISISIVDTETMREK